MIAVASSTGETIAVRCIRLRARRLGLWLRNVWSRDGHTAGAIADAEFDRLTRDPLSVYEEQIQFYRRDTEASELTYELESADAELQADERWGRLCRRFELAEHERRLLLLAVARCLEPDLGRVYAYLHDNPHATQATTALVRQMWPEYDARPAPPSVCDSWGLLKRNGEDIWDADPEIAEWLASGTLPSLGGVVSFISAAAARSKPKLFPELLASLRNASEGEIELVGPRGSGRRTLAAQLAAERGHDLLCAREAAVSAQPAGAIAIARYARLFDALVYWEGATDAALASALRAGLRIVGRETPAQDATPRRTVEMPVLARAGRVALWVHLGGKSLPEPIAEWTLTPGEIVALASTSDTVKPVTRQPAEAGALLQRLPCPYTRDDLVVQPPVREHLDELEQQIRLRSAVYEDWGFERLVPMGGGILALFAGPSGTGKTMAAQVLARTLGRELYRIDLANVVNKYIGETEKRLKQVFDACDRAHAVLLIDECDALFGQRMTAKDAHDRYANIEIDYLLQRVERFQGIGILATNRKNDMDQAFLRRIRFIIDFLPPGPKERAELWQRALLQKSPSGEALLEEIDWEMLAQKLPLTGAEIKLAALGAAFLAKARSTRIGMPHVLASAKREMQKRGSVLRVAE